VRKDQNAGTFAFVENQTTGTAARASIGSFVDSSNNGGELYAFSTGYTSSNQYAAGTALLESNTTNGLGISTINGPMNFYTNNLARMTILNGGNVGIGTTGPGEKLSVVSADNSTTTNIGRFYANNLSQSVGIGYQDVRQVAAGVQLNVNAGTSGVLNLGNTSTGGVSLAAGGGNVTFPGSGIWNSSGNVGVGTTAPGAKLESNGDVSAASGYLYTTDGSNGAVVARNGSLFLSSNGTGAVLINNSGNYGYNGHALTNGGTGGLSVYAGGGGALQAQIGGTGNTWFNSGNVGIGTTSPGANLHVLGGGTAIAGYSGQTTGIFQRTTSAGSNSRLSIIAGNQGEALLDFGDTDNLSSGYIDYNHLSDFMSFATAGTEKVRIQSSGNVGIGTTAPDRKLDVAGDIYVSTSQAGNPTTGAGIRLEGGTAPSIYGYNYGSSAWLDLPIYAKNILLMPQGTGNVGIGTTSPNTTLQVGAGTNTHTLGAGSAFITNNLELDSTLYLDGGQIANSSGTAAVILSSTPTTSPSSLSASSWELDNTANVGQAALIVNQLKGGDIFTASASGVPKFVITNAGNVGIGTTTPKGNLSITADNGGYGGMSAYAQIELNGASAPANRLAIGLNSGGTGYIQALTNLVGYNNLVLNPNGGNVGIGTTNPTAKLHVTDSSPASGGENAIYSLLPSSAVGTNADFSAGYFENRVTDVSGQGKSMGIKAYSNLSAASAYTAGIGVYAVATTNGSFSSTNYLGKAVGLQAYGSDFAIATDYGNVAIMSGNVGIGTTSAAQNLSVYSNTAGVYPTIGIQSGSSANFPLLTVIDGRASGSTWNIENGRSAAGGGLGFYLSGSGNKMLIDTGGNVGIGTTSPAQLLNLSTTGQDTNLLVDAANQNTYSPLLSFRRLSTQIWNVGMDVTDSNKFKIAAGGNYNNMTTAADVFLTITGSGNVGIGTTGPTAKLEINGTYNTAAQKLRFADNTTETGYIMGDASRALYINATSSDLRTWTATNTWMRATTNTYFDIDTGGAGNSSQFFFRSGLPASPTNIMTLTEAGNMTINGTSGVTTPQLELYNIGNDGARQNFQNNNNTNYWTLFGNPQSTAANANFALFYNGYGANVITAYGNGYVTFNAAVYGRTVTSPRTMYIDSSGNIGGISSSLRYKQNIQDMGDVSSKLYQLRPVTFEYKSNPGVTDYGLIAEEMVKVFPELVYFDDQGLPSGIAYDRLPMIELNELIKHQNALTNLQDSVASISAQLANLSVNNSGDLNITQDSNNNYQVENTNTQTFITQIAALSQAIIANIKAGAITTTDFVAQNVNAGAVIAENITTNSFAAFQGTIDNLLIKSGLVTPNLQVALISPLPNTTDVTVQIGNASQSGQFVIQNASGSAVATIDNTGNAAFAGSATVSGTLYADNIKSRSLDDIQNILTQVQTDQNLLKDAANWNVLTATDSASLTAIATADLYVTNQAAINSLSVSKTLTIGSDLVISSVSQMENGNSQMENTLDTLSAPLRIQSLAMAPVEIMNGLVTIDTKGNVNIAGDLFVAGRINSAGLTLRDNQQSIINNPQSASGSASLLTLQDQTGQQVASVDASGSAAFNNLSTQGLTIAGSNVATVSSIINGAITTNTTVGSAVIPAGTSEITIKDPKVTNYTLIYVTPTSPTNNYVLYVKSKQNGQFTVGFSNPIDVDANFNWWIVQVTQ